MGVGIDTGWVSTHGRDGCDLTWILPTRGQCGLGGGVD